MADRKIARLDLYVIGFALLFAGVYLGWQATHGGVVSHHLLDQRSMPAISNWWGLVILPLVGAFASWSVQRRAATTTSEITRAAAAAAGAFCVGVAMSVTFVVDRSGNSTMWIFLAALASGLLLPTYRPEYLFGFALGMSFVFGLVLPTVAGLVAAAISATFHLLLRPAFGWAVQRIRPLGAPKS